MNEIAESGINVTKFEVRYYRQHLLSLHYAGYQPGVSGFGWATCNTNLVKALSEHFDLFEQDAAKADVCFMPLINHNLEPASAARGKVNLAYCFFESELGPDTAQNAARYDVVFCGSSWCVERLKERGITNGELLIQGVDHEIFKPSLPSFPSVKNQFRIFSGGKFEYRKGQDLVIAAFKKFCDTTQVTRHKSLKPHLVASWFNPWPQLIGHMRSSPHFSNWTLSVERWAFSDQVRFAQELLMSEGPRPDQFTILPQLDQQSLAREMQNTDLGLFPNRCEGGTNLVLMEYLACGKPAVANILTGHADIAKNILVEIPATEDSETHWAEQTVDAIVAALLAAYENFEKIKNVGPAPALPIWSDAADKILQTAERILTTNGH